MPRQQEHQDLKKKKKRENKNECGTKRGIHGGGNQKKDGGGRLKTEGEMKNVPRGARVLTNTEKKFYKQQ